MHIITIYTHIQPQTTFLQNKDEQMILSIGEDCLSLDRKTADQH